MDHQGRQERGIEKGAAHVTPLAGTPLEEVKESRLDEQTEALISTRGSTPHITTSNRLSRGESSGSSHKRQAGGDSGVSDSETSVAGHRNRTSTRGSPKLRRSVSRGDISEGVRAEKEKGEREPGNAKAESRRPFITTVLSSVTVPCTLEQLSANKTPGREIRSNPAAVVSGEKDKRTKPTPTTSGNSKLKVSPAFQKPRAWSPAGQVGGFAKKAVKMDTNSLGSQLKPKQTGPSRSAEKSTTGTKTAAVISTRALTIDAAHLQHLEATPPVGCVDSTDNVFESDPSSQATNPELERLKSLSQDCDNMQQVGEGSK